MLSMYVKDENGEKIGYILFLRQDLCTFSICSHEDKFDKYIARAMAFQRLHDEMLKNPESRTVRYDAEYWVSRMSFEIEEYDRKRGKAVSENHSRQFLVMGHMNYMQDRANRYYSNKGVVFNTGVVFND